MGAVAVRRHEPRRAAPRSALPLDDRHDQPGHRLDQVEKALTPDKPFFLYFAPGRRTRRTTFPEWIAKYRGQFDQGWDRLREETLARQKRLGIVPPQTRLAPKPAAIRDWDQLTADEKKLFARQMEVFAGFGEYADFEIGRLIRAIEDLGQADNTLVFYIAGDNGASAEGGMNGLFNENSYFNGVRESVPEILKHYDELGSPMSYGHYAAGWAVAGDAPFTWTKQVAANFGGTRNGMVVCWPRGIKARGQFAHSSTTSSTSRRRSWRPPACRSRKSCTESRRCPSRA